jgi:cobalt-zinc-cadmium efflux system outer membrane protein
MNWIASHDSIIADARALSLLMVLSLLACPAATYGQNAETLPQATHAFQAQPGQTQGLKLDDLLAIANQNNPTLRQASAQTAATYGKAIQASLYPNPIVGYSAEQIGVKGTAGEFQGGFVQQEIVTAGKLQLSREKYLARARVAEWQATAQRQRVYNDLRSSFYQALGMIELADIRGELVKSAEDNVLTTKERFNVGQANRADLHLAQAHLERARLELLTAENELQEAWEQLTSMIGVEMPAQPLTGDLAEGFAMCEWEDILTNLLQRSPELASAQAKLKADRITLQREIVQPIPNVTVRGAAGHNFDAGETVYMAELSLPLPLYDRNQGTVQQAQADLARQQAEVRRIELDLRRRLAAEYRRYRTAGQHVHYYQTAVLPEVRTAYELRLKSYKEDRETWPNVLDAQQEYFTRRAEYVQNLVRFRQAESLVNGFLLQGGLDAAPSPTPPGHIDSVPKPR